MDPREAMTVAAEFVRQKRKFFGERIVFIRDEAETTLGIGLLTLPGGATIPKLSATVVAIGVDVDPKKYDVQIGDRILHTRYQPADVVLSRDDGTEVVVSMVHPADMYVGWYDPDLRAAFEEELKKLGITLP